MDSPTKTRRALGRGCRSAVVTVVLALTAAACSGESTTSAGGDADGGTRLAASILDGEATTVDGEPFDLATLAGSDLVVWFWAPW